MYLLYKTINDIVTPDAYIVTHARDPGHIIIRITEQIKITQWKTAREIERNGKQIIELKSKL